MKYSIALRFADTFAPSEGTIAAHEKIIARQGYVWFGKFGTPIARSKVRLVLDQNDPKILLIHSGHDDRWWASVSAIERDAPETGYPAYYGDDLSKFHCWFRITRLEKAFPNVMSQWVVPSSGKPLSEASRYSMSPYFFISSTTTTDGGR